MISENKITESVLATKHTPLKTMAELNAAEPHLRDLAITVDGLNVVDIQFAGPGVWVPRFTVQVSGDQGIDGTTGQRRVYLAAAEYLRAALLNNGTGDGTARHAFVPHANISREDEPGDQDAAVVTANLAIKHLLDVYNGVAPENDGQGVDPDLISVHGKSLHIVVQTVDFDLTEKRILSGEAFDKLQAAIDAPADPSPELVKLMSGRPDVLARGCLDDVNAKILANSLPESFIEGLTINNTTVVENGGEPLDDIIHTDVTKEFNGILHASVLLEGGFNAPHQVFWVPAGQIDQFPSLDAIRKGTTLKCIDRSDAYVEYLVLLPQGDTESQLDVRNETKLFDGIQHKLLVVPTAEGTVDAMKLWVPMTFDQDVTTFDDVSDKALLTCLSPDGEDPVEWRLLEKESQPDVRDETKWFDGVPHISKYLAASDVVLWVKSNVTEVPAFLGDIPEDKRVMVSPPTYAFIAQWRLL